jgi:hypothetical protein
MTEMTGRPSTRLEPETAWTVVTDSPLRGLSLAREAGAILAWDEGNQLYLLDIRGDSLSSSRVSQRILAGSISDEGSLIALIVEAEEAGLLLLDGDFGVQFERPAPSEVTCLTIDPHGRYLAVGTRQNILYLISRYGRAAGRLATMEPLSHLCFVPNRPLLIGAAAFGMLVAISLDPTRSAGRLDLDLVWQDRLMSNVGRLALDGSGGMILASCFTLGVQRFDLQGRNEGSYHLGGTVSHAVPDFPGRTIAAATLEGDLIVLNSAGNVRWRTRLTRPLVALEIDPLGRYLIYGHATGEIVRLDLFGGGQARASRHAAPRPLAASGQAMRTSTGSVRAPDWVVPAVESDEQAETAVLAVQDDPPTIALFTSPRRLQWFDTSGQKLGQGPDMTGVGRILRLAPGWLAAATDRQIVLCDLRHGVQRRLDVSLVELTHLAINPDEFGLALVQERDRIGRLSPSSRWIWKKELRAPIEELAIGPHEFVAVTTHGGDFLIFDPEGNPSVGLRFDPTDPPLLIEAPLRSPDRVTWVSFARRTQALRGHALWGEVLWEVGAPFEGWTLLRMGELGLLIGADGRALSFHGSGAIDQQSAPTGESNDVFFLDSERVLLRISRRGVHLICSELDGHVRWRSVLETPSGTVAAGSSGVATVLGKSLAWFASDRGGLA